MRIIEATNRAGAVPGARARSRGGSGVRAPGRGDRRPRARRRRPGAARFRPAVRRRQPPLEVSRDEMRDGRGDGAGRRAAGHPPGGAATSHASRSGRFPSTADLEVVPGVSVEQRVEPLARVGCYVPGGRFPLPSSLLMTAVPARVAGVREIVAVCPRPEPAVMAAALEAGVTRLFRVGGAHAIAALAYGTAIDSARRQDRRARQPLRRGRQGARVGRLRHRLLRRPDRDRDRRRRRARRLDRRRSGRAGRARSRRAVDLHHLEPSLADRVGRAVARAGRRPRRSSQQSLAAQRRRRSWPATPTKRWRSPTASPPSIWSSIASR